MLYSIALFQFISGSIQKNPTADFLPVLRLFRLYPDPEPLPVPDLTSPAAVEKLAAAGIFIHLRRKAQVYLLLNEPLIKD